jgi:anti-sigma B factor antagonist
MSESHPDALPPVVRVERDADGGPRLELRGELDHDTMDEFLDEVRALLPGLRADERIVVDCERLEFCDSSGLAALLMARREALARGSAIELSEQPEFVRNLLRMTGVDYLFAVADARIGAPRDDGAGTAAGSETRAAEPSGGATLAWYGASPVIRLYGEIDADCIDEVRLAWDEAAARMPRNLSIDLTELDFADSTLLHLLLDAHARTAMRLIGPLRPAVSLLLESTGLLEVFALTRNDRSERTGLVS